MEIRNIWAIGRNYAEHAKELGNPLPSEPLIFLKAGSCLAQTKSTPKGHSIFMKNLDRNIHYELEMALQFGSDLGISHFTLGIDFTDRDPQNKFKDKGQPWTLAKSFANA